MERFRGEVEGFARRARRCVRRACIVRAPSAFVRACARGALLRADAPDDAELGLLGEALVARELARRGWRVLARRRDTAEVEVDLVAIDPTTRGGELVLVEVKSGRVEAVPLPRGLATAPAPRWRAAQRFSRARLERLAALARRFRAGSARVDLVEVSLDVASGRVRFAHWRAIERPLG